MGYELRFGRIAGAATDRSNKARFRLAVLADLSGRASRGEIKVGAELASRKGRRVDTDSFDQILSDANLDLRLNLGSDDEPSVVEVPIGSLDDFHPDELFENLEFFGELSGLRRRLKSSSSFAKAAEEVRSWGGEAGFAGPKKSGSAVVPRGTFSDFSQLVTKSRGGPSSVTASIESLIKQAVGPHIVPADDPDQEKFVAAVDDALASSMRRVLHHPDFQSSEATWRSIDLLTRRLETGVSFEIVVFDISAEEFAADLSSTEDLTESGLYKLLVTDPSLDANEGAFSAVVTNYIFELTPPHADLLARIGQIGAAAQMPFIAGLSSTSIERQVKEDHPLCWQAWQALQNSPQSPYLGLVSPRFLLRWPYGKKTEPIEPFAFEEFTMKSGLRGMLWGNGAILAGLLLGQTFLQTESLSGMELGEILTVDDLPMYYYTDRHGDVVALPCGERLLTEKNAQQIHKLGCMPLVSLKNQPEVRLAGFRSVGLTELAGPWAPVEVDFAALNATEEVETVQEPDAAIDQAVESADAVPVSEADESPIDEPSVNVDLDHKDDSQEDDVSSSAGEPDSADSELDALLASLDEEDEEVDDDDDEMDSELASLLADL